MSAADDSAEIAYLEQTMQGKARPRFSPEGTCGRLAELYLAHPELPAFADKALIYVRAGLELIEQSSPFYPKLRHFEAMSLRHLAQPETGSLGMTGNAAQYDRTAIDLCYGHMPQDALVFAQQWGEWAWRHRLWDEAAEAYSRATRCLNKLLREHIGDEATRLTIIGEVASVTRGAFALVEAEKYSDAVLLLERANHFFYTMHEDAQVLQRLEQIDASLVAELRGILQGQAVYEERFDNVGRVQPQEQERMHRRDELVQRVRTYEGFEDFAAFPDWPTIQNVAAQIPLLYLFSSDYGTKALLVARDRNAALHCLAFSFSFTTQDFRDALQPFLREEFERTGTFEKEL